MAVSTEDRKVARRGGDGGLSNGPVQANVILPHGRAVFVDATTGSITNTSNAGANKFGGIGHERFDNTGGAVGDIDAEFWIEGRFQLVGSGFTQADVAKKVYLADNSDALTLTSTSASLIGSISEFVSSTVVEVNIDVQPA